MEVEENDTTFDKSTHTPPKKKPPKKKSKKTQYTKDMKEMNEGEEFKKKETMI